jgi:hypothetical protein
MRSVLTRVWLVERVEYVFLEKCDLRGALFGQMAMSLKCVR